MQGNCQSSATSEIERRFWTRAVAALPMNTVEPRPPALPFSFGPYTTRPGSKKGEISVVHSLAVLKGHPECLKCGKTRWRPGLRTVPRWGSFNAPPDSLAGGATPSPRISPRSRLFGPPTLAVRATLLASTNPFTKIRLCSELNLFYPPPL